MKPRARIVRFKDHHRWTPVREDLPEHGAVIIILPVVRIERFIEPRRRPAKDLR